MKLIFCLLLVFIFGALAEDAETGKANAFKWSRKCMDELEVSPEDMDKLANTEEVDYPKLKKMAFCLLKKAGMMTEDGDLNLEPIKKDIRERFSDEETVNEVVKDCVVKKNTPEETAGYITVCIRQQKRRANTVKWSRECTNEHEVPLEAMDKLRNKEKMDDPKLKKVAFCILKKAGMMTEDGDLNLEPIKKDIRERFSDEEKVNEVVKDCVVKKNTPEETADDMRSCINGHIIKALH